MTRSWLRTAGLSFATAVIIVACGSRTGLLSPEQPPPGDASTDQTLDVTAEDAPPLGDGPIIEGGPLDVATDCGQPPYCDPNDLGYVYQCGERIFQCSSLEQCYEGKCRNPCLDTLGQDTSNGCEFYAAEMDMVPEAAGVCYAVFIVNQWKTGEPARIQVDRGGTILPIAQFARIPQGFGTGITYGPYDPNQGLAKDEIAVLFLSRDPAAENDANPISPRKLAACPAGVTPAVVGDASLHGTGKATGTKGAFHIKTNVPVVAYSMLPFGAGRARVTGATLLLPTNVWGDNYVAANAYEAPTSFQEDRAGPTLMVLAKQDATTVTIKPVADILAGGGLGATTKGTTGTYTINKGEYLQFTQPSELTGSPIQASSPVAVIGGSTLMDVPVTRIRADSGHQMLPPVKSLGHEYVAVRYRSRNTQIDEFEPYRMVGVVDGTTLTYEPSTPIGAPVTLSAGQVVEFQEANPFVVRSQDAQHPFYMAQYMTGGEPYDGTGDPEFVNIVTPAQYLPRYTFFTDPTYPETNLVIVRQKDAQLGFPDVTLDCAGTLTGWQAVGNGGTYQFVRVDLSTGDFQGVGNCNNGVHTIEGTFNVDGGADQARFGVTVWGWGNPVTWAPDEEDNPKFTRWVSYAYPAGANIGELNSVIFPAK